MRYFGLNKEDYKKSRPIKSCSIKWQEIDKNGLYHQSFNKSVPKMDIV